MSTNIGPRSDKHKLYLARAEHARSLVKPGHYWFFVFLNGEYVGNVSGKHEDGAINRAIRVYNPNLEPVPMMVDRILTIGKWNGQQCEAPGISTRKNRNRRD